MVDTFSIAKRSEIMSRVRSIDTTPEKMVRSALHRMGFRYRLYVRNLPGKPDLVFPKYNAVLFIHGCFWHQHQGCKNAGVPKAHVKYWLEKFERNKERDQKVVAELRRMGWRVFVVWECEINNNLSDTVSKLAAKLTKPIN